MSLEYREAALKLWWRTTGRRYVPRRLLAAVNCLRGRPTMYRIKIRGGGVLHSMRGLVVTDNHFDFVDGEGVTFERINGALITHNTVKGAWTSGPTAQD